MEMTIIHPSVKLGDNVKIGNFCLIEEGVEIANNVVVEEFSIIKKESKIGENTKIGTYTKIGKGVIIGKNCSFTSYCEIRDNCKLGNYISMGSRCTLSANTVVGDNVIIKYGFVATDTPDLNQNDVKKTCVLKKGSKYGANVTIMPSLTIGENVEIGACSQVRHDVPDNEIWYGSPAKFFKKVSN